AGGLQPFVIPASASAAMSDANTWPSVSANDIAPFGSPKARTRNAAICPRVTGSSGQNQSLAGGLQPFVIPASASAAMSDANTWPSVSANDIAPFGRPKARTRTAAIWPRVTGLPGALPTLAGGLQPFVIPASASAAMSDANTWPSVSANDIAPFG